MLARSLSVVLVLCCLTIGEIASDRLDITDLFKKLDEFAHPPIDTMPMFDNLPYTETYICAMEPCKVEKCRKESAKAVKTEADSVLEKFKAIKSLLSAKISKEKSQNSDSDSVDRSSGNFQSLRVIECPESHTIKIIDAFMTNKNKYVCPPPSEAINSDSVCNSTTGTMSIVKNLCENKQKCTIKIDEQFKDVCTCIDQHYLNLTYLCLPSENLRLQKLSEIHAATHKTKRNTLRRGGRNLRLNFVDPFYDFYPQFYTGPLGVLGFDIAELGMHSAVNEPFPLNYDFFPGNWHGWGGWGNLLDFPHAHDYDQGRRSRLNPGRSNSGPYGQRAGFSDRNGLGSSGQAQRPMPFNRGGAGSFKNMGPIRAGKGSRRNTKFNLVG